MPPFFSHRSRPGFPPLAAGLWSAADGPIRALAPRVWDFDVVGNNPVPEGPLIVAANHFSHIDPVVLAVALQRPVRFLALDELFGRSRLFDAFTLWMGAIPVSRTRPPLGALRVSLGHLRRGGAVGLFPEGRRVAEWGESPPKQGAAWLAIRSGAPLLPVALAGTENVLGVDDEEFERHPLRVAFGPLLWPGRFGDRAAMTNAWWEWMELTLTELGSVAAARHAG